MHHDLLFSIPQRNVNIHIHTWCGCSIASRWGQHLLGDPRRRSVLRLGLLPLLLLLPLRLSLLLLLLVPPHHRPAGADHAESHRTSRATVDGGAGSCAVRPTSWGPGSGTGADVHHAHGVVEVHHVVASGHLLRRVKGRCLLSGHRRCWPAGGDGHAVAAHHALSKVHATQTREAGWGGVHNTQNVLGLLLL